MQTGGGETQPKCSTTEDCVRDELRADKLWKGWGLWVGTWNVDSLMGRAGELVEGGVGEQMKKIMMETAHHICGMSEGRCRHKETWSWNEEVAEAEREKKIKYKKWKRENSKEVWMEYKECRQNVKRVISSAKEKKRKECASDLNDHDFIMKFFEWQIRW